MEMTSIFVSYSHRDDRWVQAGQYGLVPWLTDQLRRFGAEFWYDPELRKLPGQAYRDRIRSEIDASQFALLLISQNFPAPSLSHSRKSSLQPHAPPPFSTTRIRTPPAKQFEL